MTAWVEYFEGLEGDLPGIDSHGLLNGASSPYLGPTIRFEPGVPPTIIPGKGFAE
jgi:hypothetical protein